MRRRNSEKGRVRERVEKERKEKGRVRKSQKVWEGERVRKEGQKEE